MSPLRIVRWFEETERHNREQHLRRLADKVVAMVLIAPLLLQLELTLDPELLAELAYMLQYWRPPARA